MRLYILTPNTPKSLYLLPTQSGLYHTLCTVLTSNFQTSCVQWSIATQDSAVPLLTLHDCIVQCGIGTGNHKMTVPCALSFTFSVCTVSLSVTRAGAWDYIRGWWMRLCIYSHQTHQKLYYQLSQDSTTHYVQLYTTGITWLHCTVWNWDWKSQNDCTMCTFFHVLSWYIPSHSVSLCTQSHQRVSTLLLTQSGLYHTLQVSPQTFKPVSFFALPWLA